MADQKSLEALIESHFPIIVIETKEEQRVVDLIKNTALDSENGIQIWTAGEGLKNHLLSGFSGLEIQGLELQDYKETKFDATTDPDEMLLKIKKSIKKSLVILLDFHHFISNPKTLRMLKEVAQRYYIDGNKLIFISHKLSVPEEIKHLCARFQMTLPSADEIHKLIVAEAKIWSHKNDSSVKADKKAIKLLVQNLLGLTISDAKRFIRNAIYNDGAITHSDIKELMEAKYNLVTKDNILSFEYDTVEFSDIGGLKSLKQWLEKRKSFFLSADKEDLLDIPKGIMLLGVQGCGKSMAAKAVAGVWGIPLLRLDIGSLYNKYIGETEKNIRQALKSAQTLSPCVLWIDEIEKGISTGSDDNGTSNRLLGTLLTWMAENKSRVFIVATSNNIASLPPELVRKGRLDEIFFVDLPDSQNRKEIAKLHITKRDMKIKDFDLDIIAAECAGFSGAEIEQAIIAARYSSYEDKSALNTDHIVNEIKQTRPLSIVMAEDIQKLRTWAKSRTVNAN